jgi:hypothetical protein
MKFLSLILKCLALLAVYAFACGALVQQSAEGYWHHFLSRLLEPLNGLNPVAGSVLVAGTFLFAAGIAIAPREEDGEQPSLLSSIVLAAFAVDAVAVAATVALIFAGSRAATTSLEIGALFVAGVAEACVGIVLGAFLVFLRRPRSVYVPALGFLLVGTAVLGSLFWFGSRTIP